MTSRFRLLALCLALATFAFTTGCDEGAEGTACTDDTECQEGLACGDDGTCQMVPDVCTDNSECGLGQVCGDDGACADAPCDDATNPCAIGETCNSGTCEAPTSAVIVQELGTVEVDSDGGPALQVDVPDGAQSLAIVVEGAGSELIIADKIRNPAGELVFDWTNDLYTNRTNATDGLYTVLVPTNPEVEVTGGRWEFVFLSGSASFTADATAIIKTAAATGSGLDLNLYFVGVDGLDAATAQTDTEFQRMISNVGQIYADAGITVGDINYTDITGTDADQFRVIDSVDAHTDELFQLFALSADASNEAVNLFFVADIVSADQGFSLLGVAGGVPGPPGIQGTLRSGVAVNMSEWIEAASGAGPLPLPDVRPKFEIIVAHETAHYLGLFHTTERNGQSLSDGINGNDPLSDTPVCEDDADGDGNGTLSADECDDADGGNLMFWSPPPTSRALTGQQGQVLRRNAVVR